MLLVSLIRPTEYQEFRNELSQNKKTTPDIAFQKFEPMFLDKQHWLKRFEDPRNATQELLPDIANTRWRGKSDYYSLFLALDALNQTGHSK